MSSLKLSLAFSNFDGSLYFSENNLSLQSLPHAQHLDARELDQQTGWQATVTKTLDERLNLMVSLNGIQMCPFTNCKLYIGHRSSQPLDHRNTNALEE